MTTPGTAEPLKKWRYKDLEVSYRDHLDGGGMTLVPAIVRFITNNFPEKRFRKAFEWCSGPGFIGFSLLREGICDALCLADISGEAIACVADSVRGNGLEQQVSYYVSDNCDGLPPAEVFDLVVANPPNYLRLNPEHRSYEKYRRDLRANDSGWETHQKFYAQIRRHLAPGAILLISEVEPFSNEVYLHPGEPAWDVRDHPPLIDFKSMIAEAGLTYLKTVPYFVADGLTLYMVMSECR